MVCLAHNLVILQFTTQANAPRPVSGNVYYSTYSEAESAAYTDTFPNQNSESGGTTAATQWRDLYGNGAKTQVTAYTYSTTSSFSYTTAPNTDGLGGQTSTGSRSATSASGSTDFESTNFTSITTSSSSSKSGGSETSSRWQWYIGVPQTLTFEQGATTTPNNGSTGTGSSTNCTFAHYPQTTTTSSYSTALTKTAGTTFSPTDWGAESVLLRPISIAYGSTHSLTSWSLDGWSISTFTTTLPFYTGTDSTKSSTWESLVSGGTMPSTSTHSTETSSWTAATTTQAAVAATDGGWAMPDIVVMADDSKSSFLIATVDITASRFDQRSFLSLVTSASFSNAVSTWSPSIASINGSATTGTYSVFTQPERTYETVSIPPSTVEVTRTSWDDAVVPNSSSSSTFAETVYPPAVTDTVTVPSYTFLGKVTAAETLTSYQGTDGQQIKFRNHGPLSTHDVQGGSSVSAYTVATRLNGFGSALDLPGKVALLVTSQTSSNWTYGAGGSWTASSEDMRRGFVLWESSSGDVLIPSLWEEGHNAPGSSVQTSAAAIQGSIGTTLSGLSQASVSAGIACLLPLPVQATTFAGTVPNTNTLFPPMQDPATSNHTTQRVSMEGASLSWSRAWQVAAGSSTSRVTTSGSGVLSNGGVNSTGPYLYPETGEPILSAGATAGLFPGLYAATVNASTGTSEVYSFFSVHTTSAATATAASVLGGVGRAESGGGKYRQIQNYVTAEV